MVCFACINSKHLICSIKCKLFKVIYIFPQDVSSLNSMKMFSYLNFSIFRSTAISYGPTWLQILITFSRAAWQEEGSVISSCSRYCGGVPCRTSHFRVARGHVPALHDTCTVTQTTRAIAALRGRERKIEYSIRAAQCIYF